MTAKKLTARQRLALSKRILKAKQDWLESLDEIQDAFEEAAYCVEDGLFSDAQGQLNLLINATCFPLDFINQKDQLTIENLGHAEDVEEFKETFKKNKENNAKPKK